MEDNDKIELMSAIDKAFNDDKEGKIVFKSLVNITCSIADSMSRMASAAEKSAEALRLIASCQRKAHGLHIEDILDDEG